MGWADSLEIEGEENINVYNAELDSGTSQVERRFCGKCGSALWVYHAKWPDLVHPFASAIDTDLPISKETVHMMLDFKANWVEVPAGAGHVSFAGYPDKSIEVWHDRQKTKSKP